MEKDIKPTILVTLIVVGLIFTTMCVLAGILVKEESKPRKEQYQTVNLSDETINKLASAIKEQHE